jgi:peroxiredoxin
MSVAVGERARSFRLPSGQGPDVGLEDFRGRSSVIVWFTKGMACPFCRAQMSQLGRGYSTFKALGAELLEVTPTAPARARHYVEKFRIPFPYLCDPDHAARSAWGLEVRPESVLRKAAKIYQGLRMPKPANDFGPTGLFMGELPAVLADDDMGFFIVDRTGVVRYALAAAYGRQIPNNEEIVRELERSRGA